MERCVLKKKFEERKEVAYKLFKEIYRVKVNNNNYCYKSNIKLIKLRVSY